MGQKVENTRVYEVDVSQDISSGDFLKLVAGKVQKNDVNEGPVCGIAYENLKTNASGEPVDAGNNVIIGIDNNITVVTKGVMESFPFKSASGGYDSAIAVNDTVFVGSDGTTDGQFVVSGEGTNTVTVNPIGYAREAYSTDGAGSEAIEIFLDVEGLLDRELDIIEVSDEAGLATDVEVATAVTDHNALDTGVHGAGGDVLATDADLTADIATHNALDTGVHGAGGSTVATEGDISAHSSDTTNQHGIADTSALALSSDLTTHNADTTAVHGIADTSALSLATDLTTHEADTSTHGVADMTVLATETYADTAEADANTYSDGLASNYDASGSAATAESNSNTYSDGLASNYEAAGAVSTHEADTTAVHGIVDTSALALSSDLTTHSADTTAVHGIADTSALATEAYADTAEADANTYSDGLASNYEAAGGIATHSAVTTSVHGIADTSTLATEAYADTAEANANTYSDGLASNYEAAGGIATHTAVTTSVNGIADTSALALSANVPTISSGSGAPGTTPGKIGDLYVDTAGPTLYFAKGTASSADWIAS